MCACRQMAGSSEVPPVGAGVKRPRQGGLRCRRHARPAATSTARAARMAQATATRCVSWSAKKMRCMPAG